MEGSITVSWNMPGKFDYVFTDGKKKIFGTEATIEGALHTVLHRINLYMTSEMTALAECRACVAQMLGENVIPFPKPAQSTTPEIFQQ